MAALVSFSAKLEKSRVRERVWSLLVERGVALPPFPVQGRIPNFRGAREAAELLRGCEEYQRAEVIFCNPDSPQRHVRELALRDEKTLIVATPRLKRGFLILKDVRDPERASTIRGAFGEGELVDWIDERIDLKVVGAVAVSLRGEKLGKSKGYGDLEYAILREMGCIDEETPIATTVHELQLVEGLPTEEHDAPVDLIATPKRLIRVEPRRKRPKGIRWEIVERSYLEEIPILKGLKSSGTHESKGDLPRL